MNFPASIVLIAGQTEEYLFTTEEENETTEDLHDLETSTTIAEQDGVAEDEFQTQSPMFPQIKIVGGIIVQNREDFPYQVSKITYKMIQVFNIPVSSTLTHKHFYLPR